MINLKTIGNLKRHDAGLTLIELLIVLVVMGILAGISYVSLGTSQTNSRQNSCKTAYQAIALAVASYQSDNAGSLPPSLAALQPTYLSTGLVSAYSVNFTLQLGSYAVINEALTSSVATLKISSAYAPPITIGETIQIAGVDSANLDGTWTVASFTGSATTYTITYTAVSANTIASTVVNSSGAILNLLSTPANSYDVYLYNSKGARVGTTAPSACLSLT
jgi:prepilin-type N-terminal cleavage/methylation domain-containing protein